MLPTLILAGLAAAQITYFVTTSVIFDRPRGWIEGLHANIAYWVTCPWCFSAWASAAIIIPLHRHLDYDVLAWAAVWWIACTAYWLSQALARYAES